MRTLQDKSKKASGVVYEHETVLAHLGDAADRKLCRCANGQWAAACGRILGSKKQFKEPPQLAANDKNARADQPQGAATP
jgi:hypothetical protein